MRGLLLISITVAGLTVSCNETIAQGAWTRKADFGGTARFAAASFSIGTKGYIGIGSGASTYLKDFWEWDQTTDAWTQKANFGGTARFAAVGFSIYTKGYITTGYDGTGELKDLWEWDQQNNTWTKLTDFAGNACAAAVVFVIGNKGYFATGYGVQNDFWEWDPATNIWVQKANFPGFGRNQAIGFSIGTKGYIGTGTIPTIPATYLKDFWEWDQATNTWIQKSDFPGIERSIAVGFSIGSKGYVGTGGDGTYAFYQDFWEWDQTTDTWTQKTNSPGLPRKYATGFSIGNKGYIGMGYDSTSMLRDFWEFDPNGNGVNDIENRISLSLFPNPFSTQATLLSDNLLSNAALTIYNSRGQAVKQITGVSGRSITLHRDNLPSGLYFLSLREGCKLFTDKLIIAD